MSDSKKLALLILVMSALRAAAACAFPLNASEAYYWCWGRHLAAGYYDHPPMVAWVAALFAGWVNGSELAARCGPIVLGALTTLVIFALAKELFPGGRTAWRAALLYALTPLFDLNAVILQPDNPLILFTTLPTPFVSTRRNRLLLYRLHVDKLLNGCDARVCRAVVETAYLRKTTSPGR
ncbi:MAG: glycosyltransferase family 39 protein [Candidatus Sumerlaeota bacterium]|nr:glycosyltransferase family 39 protein [Candidatus Sumerlaeota bacterium]